MRSADAYHVDLRGLHHSFDVIECTHAVLFAEADGSIERGAAYRDEVRVLEIRESPGMKMTDLSAADNGRSEFYHGNSVLRCWFESERGAATRPGGSARCWSWIAWRLA
jgi:hypothetical protein